MHQVKLEANIREKTGTGVARKLRRQGRVPAVLYGPYLQTPMVLDVNAKEMERVLRTAGRTSIISLNVPGGPKTVMLADYQRDVFGTHLLSVDFKQVRLDEKVTASVPISLVGQSKGIKAGGVLEQMVREVQVEALPLDLPDSLEIDITELDLGERLTMADLPVSDKMTYLVVPDETLAVIHTPRSLIATEEEEQEETTETAE
jgi:large subunit ribosomal protein L25